MRLSSTLFVTEHRARVGTSKASLQVTQADGTRTRIPMESLDAVVLLGQAQVTSQAMAECVRRGIPITSLTRGGSVRFSVRGQTNGNVQLRRAQHAASVDAESSLQLSRLFVAGKLQNARRALQRWSWDAPSLSRGMLERRRAHVEDRLVALDRAGDLEQLRGMEGEAARQYFRGMSSALSHHGLGFRSRTRRPPRDVANALMSFTYGLVTAELVGALEAIGLDPQVGFFHQPRPGRPALALDLLEELRTGHADRFVVRSLTRREIVVNDFESRPGGAIYLKPARRKHVLARYETFREEEVHHGLFGRRIERWAVPHAQVLLLARHLRGDLFAYAPYVVA